MFDMLFISGFFAVPVILILLFAISLVRYLSAKVKNKKIPGAFSHEEIKKRKIILIIVSVVACVCVAIVAGFVALLFMAVAYM